MAPDIPWAKVSASSPVGAGLVWQEVRGGARRPGRWPWARGARRWCHCCCWWQPHCQPICRWNPRNPVSCSGGAVVGVGAATRRWGTEGDSFSDFHPGLQEVDLLSGKALRTCFLRGGPASGCTSTVPLLCPRIKNSTVFDSNALPHHRGVRVGRKVHTVHVGSVPSTFSGSLSLP